MDIFPLVYRIDKEYKTFKTQILSEELSEIDGYIIIFGDNKELYKSEPLNKLNNNKIEIDVTNIKELKIAYIGAKNASDINIYLVEPYLYR